MRQRFYGKIRTHSSALFRGSRRRETAHGLGGWCSEKVGSLGPPSGRAQSTAPLSPTQRQAHEPRTLGSTG